MVEMEIICNYEDTHRNKRESNSKGKKEVKTKPITENTFEGLLAHMLGYKAKLSDLKNNPDYILRDVPFFVFREVKTSYEETQKLNDRREQPSGYSGIIDPTKHTWLTSKHSIALWSILFLDKEGLSDFIKNPKIEIKQYAESLHPLSIRDQAAKIKKAKVSKEKKDEDTTLLKELSKKVEQKEAGKPKNWLQLYMISLYIMKDLLIKRYGQEAIDPLLTKNKVIKGCSNNGSWTPKDFLIPYADGPAYFNGGPIDQIVESGDFHIHLYVPDMETAERYKKEMYVPKDLFLGSRGSVEIGMISLTEVEKSRIQTHYIEIPVDNNLSAVWEAIHRVLWDNKKGNIGLSLIRSETDHSVNSVKTDYDTNAINNARTWEETKIVRLHGFEEDLKDLEVFSSYKELINLVGPKILEIKKIPTVLAGTANLSLRKLPKKEYRKSREPLFDEECDTRTRRMRRRAQEKGFSENEAKLKYPGRVIGEEHNPEKDPNCIFFKSNSNENLIPFKLFQSLFRSLGFSNSNFKFNVYGCNEKGADSKVPFW